MILKPNVIFVQQTQTIDLAVPMLYEAVCYYIYVDYDMIMLLNHFLTKKNYAFLVPLKSLTIEFPDKCV